MATKETLKPIAIDETKTKNGKVAPANGGNGDDAGYSITVVGGMEIVRKGDAM